MARCAEYKNPLIDYGEFGPRPPSRIRAVRANARAGLAADLLAEGKMRLAEMGGQYAGLMQMDGILERWPDTPPEAKKLLSDYDDKPEKPSGSLFGNCVPGMNAGSTRAEYGRV